MKTKTTKKQIIQALKVHMNSVMIERHKLDEELLSANINGIQYATAIKDLLKDLQQYVELL